MKILVINAGSSSLKFQLFDMDNEKVIAKGNCEKIGLSSPVISYKQRGCEPAVVTYTDKTISSVWQVFGCMFGLTFVLIAAFCVLYEQSVNFILMLPLSLLYCGLGVSINGIILREKWMIYSPVVAFVLVIYMLMSLINHGPVTVLWYLYFGLSFVVMMIIPGHILNNKAKKQCLKN